MNPKIFYNLTEEKVIEVQLKGCSTANLTHITVVENGLGHELLSVNVEIDNLNYQSKFIHLSKL